MQALPGSCRRLDAEAIRDGDRVEADTAGEWLWQTCRAPGRSDVERRRETIIQRARPQNRA